MIIGHNFNGQAIPEQLRKRFKKVLQDGSWLAGVATTAQDRDTALIVADNGHRTVTVVEAKDHMGPLFGIYVKGSAAQGLGTTEDKR